MLKRLALGLAALFLLIAPAYAAPNTVVSYDVGVCSPWYPQRCLQPNVDGSLNVSGTITATLGGFTPTAGATATLTATTTSSSVAIPASAAISVSNPGTTNAFVRLTTGAGTAVVTDQVIYPNSTVGFATGTNNTLSAITASGSDVLLIQGGTGLVTGLGGGGTGGSGSNASVGANNGTQPTSSTQLGYYNGTTFVPLGAAVGLPVNVINSVLPVGASTSALQTTGNASLTAMASVLGTTADAVYTGTGNATLPSIEKGIYAAATSPIPAGTNIIGKVGIDQTTPGTTNGVQTLTGSVTSINGGAVGLLTGSQVVGKFGVDQTTPFTTNNVTVSGKIPAGTSAPILTDTAGRLLPGQGIPNSPGLVTLTASTATAISGAVTGRIGFELQSEVALTANLYICFTATTTCSATVHDKFFPTGTAAGVLYTSIFGFQSTVYGFSTQAVVLNPTNWTVQ